MTNMQQTESKRFLGRESEKRQLHKFSQLAEAAMMVVYGRRRVGKTELIEQYFAKKNLIKLEGLEGKGTPDQIEHVLQQIAGYAEQSFIKKLHISNWVELFELLNDLFANDACVLYFEEVQWLADYQDDFASALKYVWDNKFRHHQRLKIILCGSSPSFMINKIIQSKALYNRTLYELHLKEFSIAETKEYLNIKSNIDTMNAYLTVGGIPEYLKRLIGNDSIFLNICQESFHENGFFTTEFQRIFISSFAQNIHYKAIVEYLSRKRFATRSEIMQHLKTTSGGSLSEILYDLEQCGFIERYVPFQADEDSMLARYTIVDKYLRFYYKFIKPKIKDIKKGQYSKDPAAAIAMNIYQQWLGYAFENYCRNHHWIIAKILGFSALNYRSGAYFSRKTDKDNRGFQIDLIFERADRVYTICEIKYSRAKVDVSVIDEFEEKLMRFENPKQRPIQRVLISSSGITAALEKEHYFDRVITLDDLIC